MRYKDLTEEAPSKDIRNLVSTIALSLIAIGKEQVGTQSLRNEIRKRTNIDIPYGVLMDILSTLPFVQDVNSDIVTLQGDSIDNDQGDELSSEEKVTDMATKAASARL